jgi:hypothetical protein
MRTVRALLVLSLLTVITGSTLNYFYGFQGGVYLVEGERTGSLWLDSLADFGFDIELEAVSVAAHTPIYEIQLWEQDSSVLGHLDADVTSTGKCTGRFPLEAMKIFGIPGSDFGFRLSEFYPNFRFAYTYPDRIDTIPPRAPGVTLQMSTDVGTPVLTLRGDQPGRDTMADIIGLNATLQYVWSAQPDSIEMIIGNTKPGKDKILLIGELQKIILISDQNPIETETPRDAFFMMPGRNDTGFKVLQWFPDAAYLKAEPVSDGEEILNPVAGVHVWREGQGYQEVFLYPRTRGRRGGYFAVPGGPQYLVLGLSNDEELRHCAATAGIYNRKTGSKMRDITLEGSKAAHYARFRFTLERCYAGAGAVMDASYRPGKWLIWAGTGIGLLAFGLLLGKEWRKKSHRDFF